MGYNCRIAGYREFWPTDLLPVERRLNRLLILTDGQNVPLSLLNGPTKPPVQPSPFQKPRSRCTLLLPVRIMLIVSWTISSSTVSSNGFLPFEMEKELKL